MDTPERKIPHETGTAVWRTSDLMDTFLVATSLPHDEQSHRMAILSIIDSECHAGSDLIGSEMYVGEYIVHPVALTDDETGEQVIARRLVLPQPDDIPVAFVSEGCIKSLERISWAVGRQPPWDPPVKVRLIQKKTSRGRRTFLLVPVQ